MERPRTSFIVLSTVLMLLIQLFITSVMAQTPNTSLAQNQSTLRIMDMKNHTITIVDKLTNNTISVKSFTPKTVGNTTTYEILTTNTGNATTNGISTPEKTTINETLTTNTGNATTNGISTPEKTTINETLTTNTGNATTNLNLTEKFNSLQGK